MRIYALLKEYSDIAAEQLALCNDFNNITYKQLFNIIKANAIIIQKNFKKEGIVILKTENKLEFVISFLSYVIAGVWCVPMPSDINKRMEQKIKSKYKLLDPLQKEKLYYSDDNIVDDRWDCQECAEAGILHLTSGSTGSPKLCIRSMEALILEGLNYQKTLAIKEKEKILSLAPVNHSFALGAGLMASLISRGTLYLMDVFMPRKAVSTIESFGANMAIAVPNMVKAMNKVKILHDLNLTDFHKILVGAGAISGSEQSRFKEKFGACVYGNYGSTETGGIFTRMTNVSPLSIGRPMMGIEVKILNPCMEEVEKGAVGELYVKCPYSMEKYYMCSEKAINKDGFLPMGDLVKEDANGQYIIVGRIKNIIRIGGKQVNPYEVEQSILMYPEIEDVYVYEEKREDGESIVSANIVGKNIEETALRKFLSLNLERYKIPSKIQYVTSITRNSVGKVIFQGDDTID